MINLHRLVCISGLFLLVNTYAEASKTYNSENLAYLTQYLVRGIQTLERDIPNYRDHGMKLLSSSLYVLNHNVTDLMYRHPFLFKLQFYFKEIGERNQIGIEECKDVFNRRMISLVADYNENVHSTLNYTRQLLNDKVDNLNMALFDLKDDITNHLNLEVEDCKDDSSKCTIMREYNRVVNDLFTHNFDFIDESLRDMRKGFAYIFRNPYSYQIQRRVFIPVRKCMLRRRLIH